MSFRFPRWPRRRLDLLGARCTRVAALGATLAIALVTACGDPPDCSRVCETSLACEVTFEAPDDPNERLVDTGERTEAESCAIGCQASPLIDADSERCITGVDARDPQICQPQILACLEVDS